MVSTRIEYARHPVVVGLFAALAVVALSQLVFGPTGSKVVLDMASSSQRFFAGLLFVSAIGCLASAFIRRPLLGARIERASMFGVAVALGFYALTLRATIPSYSTSMAFVFAGIAFGAAYRAGIVWRLIRRYHAAAS